MHQTSARGAAGCPALEDAAGLDLFDTGFVRDPYPLLGHLRRAAPVHYDSATGLWLISRYADVRQILLDPATYRPDNAQQAVAALSVPTLRTLARAGFKLPPALANNSSSTHTGLRRVVTRFFNSARVAAATPLIDATARQILTRMQDRYVPGADCDLAADYARPLPCMVMLQLLGIADMPASTLLAWSDASLELFYGWPSPERQAHLVDLVCDFYRWLTSQVTDAAPSHSLIGALRSHRMPSGEPVDPATVVAVCFFAFIAGQSTTGQLISTVLRHALADADVWERSASDESFASAWVEEVLRREPPVTTWRRVTAREVELSEVRLPAGSQLLLMLMGTGSDPEIFDQPDRMDPYRANIRHHLSFGAGRHRCLGASLARTEAAVALRVAARLLPDATLTKGADPQMLGLLSFRAPTRVLVRHN
ncbi:cytochrome P450 [Streptomyces tanashiensis]|uniref:cytochrome P450 n=1 Tax=Streptomyces tanashiensis TaxID=67367 RepID=UPI0016728EE4|nr:cytochrome P450 [Streptomyces tanashiensis]GGS72391.1 cytochrome P450 [Streptomyces tanashiensis]